MEPSILTIACPECMALNAVPADRSRASEACHACKSPLFAAKPITLTSANFEAHARTSDLPLLIDFWSPEYAAILLSDANFEKAASQLEPDFRLGRLDIEDEAALAERFEISSIPTYLIIRHGRELARRRGSMLTQTMVEWARFAITP